MRLLSITLLGALAACSSKHTSSQGRHGLDNHEIEKIYAEAARPQLTKFGSEQELATLFTDLTEAHEKQMRERESMDLNEGVSLSKSAEPSPASTGSGSESITNTQVAGVDEGGIVKVHGDHLVVLRRGRLFTVKVGDDSLTPIGHADAYGPNDPSGTWYDEMLVSGDTAIVIGYSYARGGTEVGLFDLGADGSVAYRATYHLRSNDYYSARNYASRIVGGKLVFYSPMYLSFWGKNDPMSSLPAIRRWHTGATDQEFHRILSPTEIYRPVAGFSAEAMHTVTTCDLSTKQMECTATAVMGPAGRTFYVSEKAVYVWATTWSGTQHSMVVRMPLDGSAPTAIKTRGAPIDQFSFLEKDGFLDVFVRSEGKGDAMWAPEVTEGDAAMLRVPVALFSANVPDAPNKAYAQLPKPGGYDVQNRFVGDTLLYGSGGGWGYGTRDPKLEKLFVYPVAGGSPEVVPLAHPVDRIEALGKDAIIVGGNGTDLHFTSIALDRHAVAGSYVRRGAAQGETRSHGFFYKPADDHGGILGLPIRSASQPGAAQLVEGSASIVFVKNQDLQLTTLGELEAGRDVGLKDSCKASCVDWYGNARPIFMRGRMFALLGYELVEGRTDGQKVVERRRVSFAPSISP